MTGSLTIFQVYTYHCFKSTWQSCKQKYRDKDISELQTKISDKVIFLKLEHERKKTNS